MSTASVWLTCEDCGKKFKYYRSGLCAKDARDREKWAKENITKCPYCYKKSEHRRFLNKAYDKIKDLELSELTGTDRQIRSASDIRAGFLYFEMDSDLSDVFFDNVNAHTSAKWWVSHRNVSYQAMHDYFNGGVDTLDNGVVDTLDNWD